MGSWVKQHFWTLCLLVILLMATGLRLWGLDFGLPNLSRPDEQNISRIALFELLVPLLQGRGDGNPHWFEYPTLYLYGVSLLYGAYYALGSFLGLFTSVQDLTALYVTDTTNFHMISRGFTALLGIVTVYFVYGLTQTLTYSRVTALWAALLMAVVYLHVRDSHFGVTDVPATFWTTGCLWLCALYYRTQERRFLLLACLTTGLAAATKYPAGLVGLSVLGSYFFAPQSRPMPGGEKLLAVGWLGSFMLLGFFLGSPYVLLDFPTFWKDFHVQREHLAGGHGLDLGAGWVYHARFSLWYGLGPGLLALGVGGLVWSLWRRKSAFWIPALFLLAYYGAMGMTQVVFVRYMIPLVPVLCLYAAWTVRGLGRTLARRFGRSPVLLMSLLILPAIIDTGMQSVRLDRLLVQEDTRTQTRQWIITHAPPGSCVGTGMALTHLELPPTYHAVQLEPVEDESALRALQGRGFKQISQVLYHPKNTLWQKNRAVISTYSDASALNTLRCPYIVLAQTPLTLYNPPAFEWETVRRTYPLVAAFSPDADPEHPPQASDFDQLDAFYIPFRNLTSIQRPGPQVSIFQVPAAQPVAPTLVPSPPKQ